MNKYITIERDLVSKYKIVLNPYSTCRSRTHAHSDGTRRICKYTYTNSIESLFTLAHEIGHIMTYRTKMRRCESEFMATVWALQELSKYDVEVPLKVVDAYQSYINNEMDRGLRRGGVYHFSKDDLNLNNYKYVDLKLNKIKDPIQPKRKPHRVLLG